MPRTSWPWCELRKLRVAEEGDAPDGALHHVGAFPVFGGEEDGVDEPAALVEVEAEDVSSACLAELVAVEAEEELALLDALEGSPLLPLVLAVELGEGGLELGRRLETVDELVHERDVELGLLALEAAADEPHRRAGDAEGVEHQEGGGELPAVRDRFEDGRHLRLEGVPLTSRPFGRI
jgi:hypothetical protein